MQRGVQSSSDEIYIFMPGLPPSTSSRAVSRPRAGHIKLFIARPLCDYSLLIMFFMCSAILSFHNTCLRAYHQVDFDLNSKNPDTLASGYLENRNKHLHSILNTFHYKKGKQNTPGVKKGQFKPVQDQLLTSCMNFLQTGRTSLLSVALNIMHCFSWGVSLKISCTSCLMSVTQGRGENEDVRILSFTQRTELNLKPGYRYDMQP